MRIIRIITLAAVAALLTALPSAVRADEPRRSGTILSGTGETPVNPWVRGMEGCVGAPTCSAWLQSGCNPAMTGANPALHAAIVDVADLADGVTLRSFAAKGAGGPLIVQFWTGGLDGQWCGEILASRVNLKDCQSSATYRCRFRIPGDARFMTITSRLDHINVEWSLT